MWVDTRAKGTRIGPIGAKALPANIQSAKFESPPECMSFTFDADGYCTRITAASVLDPLLGNTGLLGGVYGILYATGTPEIVLKVSFVDGAMLFRLLCILWMVTFILLIFPSSSSLH